MSRTCRAAQRSTSALAATIDGRLFTDSWAFFIRPFNSNSCNKPRSHKWLRYGSVRTPPPVPFYSVKPRVFRMRFAPYPRFVNRELRRQLRHLFAHPLLGLCVTGLRQYFGNPSGNCFHLGFFHPARGD